MRTGAGVYAWKTVGVGQISTTGKGAPQQLAADPNVRRGRSEA